MNSHYYVIGKTYEEMVQYTKDRAPNINHVWVFDEVAITEENPSGVFIGNWRERPDIMDILNKLIELSTDKNKKDLFEALKFRVLYR